jgi:hypothetical protein
METYKDILNETLGKLNRDKEKSYSIIRKRILKTNVVNVKVAHIRPQYNNLKEWMDDKNNVYIGRGGIVFIDDVRFPKYDSFWGNPYKRGRDGNIDEVLEKYETHIINNLNSLEKEEAFLKLFHLMGKNLGCWCKDHTKGEIKCHGDVLLKLLHDAFACNL